MVPRAGFEPEAGAARRPPLQGKAAAPRSGLSRPGPRCGLPVACENRSHVRQRAHQIMTGGSAGGQAFRRRVAVARDLRLMPSSRPTTKRSRAVLVCHLPDGDHLASAAGHHGRRRRQEVPVLRRQWLLRAERSLLRQRTDRTRKPACLSAHYEASAPPSGPRAASPALLAGADLSAAPRGGRGDVSGGMPCGSSSRPGQVALEDLVVQVSRDDGPPCPLQRLADRPWQRT